MKLLKMSSNAIFPQVISLAPNKAKKKLELAVNTYLAIYFEGLLCFNNSFVKYLEQLINELMVRKISNDIALTRNEIINIGTRYGTISFSCKTSCSNKYSGLPVPQPSGVIPDSVSGSCPKLSFPCSIIRRPSASP